MDEDELIMWLDCAVHEAKSKEAAAINNTGVEAQLEYLGITREQAERELANELAV